MARKKRASGGRSAEQIKNEILVELRNIIQYRKELLQPTDSLNYEDIHKKILSFAGAAYHFNERLAAWCRKRGVIADPTLHQFAESNTALLVCGDLFNAKKHGSCGNKSNLSPMLSPGMSLQSAGKPLSISYDGQMKTGTIGPAVPY